MAAARRSKTFPVSREALWELLSDTERLNRELRLPSVAFAFTPRREGGSTLRGTARFGPLTLRYTEEPYRWVRPSLWWVQRFPENGPVSVYRVGVNLEPDGAGTRLTAWSEAEPRGIGGTLLAQRIVESSVDGLLRACTSFAAYLEGKQPTPYPKHTPHATDSSSPHGLAERLRAFLLTAPPEDIIDFRPFGLADRWQEDRMVVLKACLDAVRRGELELHWRLLCPACRGAGPSVETLDALTPDKAHCPSCNISFGPAFDQDVEVCFSVAPALRKADDGAATYCIGGPHRMRHVVVQWQVPLETKETLAIDLPAGEYRVRSPQASQVASMELVSDLEGGQLAFIKGGIYSDFSLGMLEGPGRGRARFVSMLPAKGTLELRNDATFPVLFRLESLGWREDAATAAQVTALGEFRRHFGSEVLAPGQELVVRQVTILFTDLKGSTQMYATQGDAPSYATVRAHFEQLTQILERHDGALIKTIGDAVMAAFQDPAQAVQAALAIQRECAPLVVKLGLHNGPALAVTANGQLDYFGQTVNLASRVQGQSHGGDIVVTDSLIAYVPEAMPRASFTAQLKGTDQPLTLWRLLVPALPL